MQTVYRVTPGPSHDDDALRAPAPAPKIKIDTRSAQRAAASPTVEKQHRLAKQARLEMLRRATSRPRCKRAEHGPRAPAAT